MSYGGSTRERLEILVAELADIRDALKHRQKPDDRRVFEEMAGDLAKEIRRVEKCLASQSPPSTNSASTGSTNSGTRDS